MKLENKMFKTILEYSQTGFVIFDENLNVLYVNKYIENLAKEHCACLTSLYKSRCNSSSLVEFCNRCNDKGCQVSQVLNQVAIDRKCRVLNNLLFTTGRIINHFNCSVQYIEGYIVMEFKEAEREKNQFLMIENLLDSVDELMCYKADNLKYQYINKAYAEFLGKDKEEVLNLTDKELLPPELATHCTNSDLLALQKGELVTYEEVGDVIYKVRKLKYENGIFLVGKDVTKEQHYGKLAFIDQLTGVYNRHKFMEEISEIYKSEKNTYYLGLIDLDGLRDLNNTYGHHKGDSYLGALGGILQNIFKNVSYRLGGDEFAILISEKESDIKGKISYLFDDLKQLNLQPKMTISMGVRRFDISLSYQENYELTDRLLYAAKTAGKNDVVFDFQELERE